MYPGRYYPGRVLSQPLRNLPGKVRNPDVRRTSETLRFRCSGPIWQRIWISAGGRGRSGDTGTDGCLVLPGNRGLPAKNGNYRSKQGCMTRNGRTYAAWRLLNAQRWNPTHRPQFASSSRDRDERVRIGARTIRFRIHYAPKTKNLTYH